MATVSLAACGGSGARSAPTTSAPTTSTTEPTTAAPTTPPTTAVPGPPAPLTGLPEPSATQSSAIAVVVKIDNVDQARPQAGIGQADVVYEEEVEGGLSRLAAVFQSRYPTQVGPVRSGRLTDLGIMDDLNHPVFAYSGANAMFDPVLLSQPAFIANDNNAGGLFAREGPFPAPHNLYASVVALAGVAKGKGSPPPALFTYLPAGTAFGGAGVATASAFAMNFPAASVRWAWNPAGNVWQRSQNGTPDADTSRTQLAAANVIVQSTGYVTSGYATGEGLTAPTPIPKGILVGQGTAWIFSAGQVVKGTWSRSSLTSTTTYSDSAGHPVALTPGVTWVELLPSYSSPSITP